MSEDSSNFESLHRLFLESGRKAVKRAVTPSEYRSFLKECDRSVDEDGSRTSRPRDGSSRHASLFTLAFKSGIKAVERAATPAELNSFMIKLGELAIYDDTLTYSLFGRIDDKSIAGLLSAVVVCPECFQLAGRLAPVRYKDGSKGPERFQACAHRPDPSVAPGSPGVRWEKYDYNLAVRLCRCCGLTPLWSGNRYSGWFCGACAALIDRLHALCKRSIFPFGPHSILQYRGGRAPVEPGLLGPLSSDREVKRHVQALKSLWAAGDILFEWYRTVVPWNLADLGFTRGTEVSLVDYNRKWQELNPDPYPRFLGLWERFRIRSLGDAAQTTPPPARKGKRKKAS